MTLSLFFFVSLPLQTGLDRKSKTFIQIESSHQRHRQRTLLLLLFTLKKNTRLEGTGNTSFGDRNTGERKRNKEYTMQTSMKQIKEEGERIVWLDFSIIKMKRCFKRFAPSRLYSHLMLLHT